MKKNNCYSLLALALTGLISACGANTGTEKSHGSIVLGDPKTIVTETDSQYLKDMVMDLEENAILPATVAVSKDTFNNIAAAKKLDEEMRRDSLNAVAAKKKQEAAAAKNEKDKAAKEAVAADAKKAKQKKEQKQTTKTTTTKGNKDTKAKTSKAATAKEKRRR